MKNRIKKGFNKVNQLDTHWRYAAFVGISVVVLLVVFSGYLITHGAMYQGKVLPGVHVGEFSLSGMSEEEVLEFLDTRTQKQFKEGIRISFDSPEGKKQFSLTPGISKDDSGFDVRLDVQKDASRIFEYGKVGNVVIDAWSAFAQKFIKPDLEVFSLSIDEAGLKENLEAELSEYIKDPISADLHIVSVDPLAYEITTSSPGVSFDFQNVLTEATQAWKSLATAEVLITAHIAPPEVTEEELAAASPQVGSIFSAGKHTIKHFDTHTKKNHTWTLKQAQISEWLDPVKREDGTIVFGLNPSSTYAFLKEKIAPDIDVEPKNAEFTLSEGGVKAIKIVGHRPGVTVDLEQVHADINDAFATRLNEEMETITETPLSVAVVEPDITLADTNDLGITEILGQGYSNFSGSPRNRILNIKNAVYNKLHGTIIKPGAEFSLNNTLRPYTLEAGYLPELVIVGNRIKPEVAGGLCQVGTTMFRTAMNSGLPITQRVNHGLVVGYYNDISNGNPGTDATIYDGWPDFRFENDTGNHMAVTVAMNANTGDLTFTLWGTSDGRKGSYTPPVVSKWIPAGPYKEIQTTDLAPGERECQSVHPGAEASFTYTRKLASGEVINRVFNSTYRAVPATCYVGVEEITQCQEDGSGEGCSIGEHDEDDEDKELLDSILEEDFAILPNDE